MWVRMNTLVNCIYSGINSMELPSLDVSASQVTTVTCFETLLFRSFVKLFWCWSRQ